MQRRTTIKLRLKSNIPLVTMQSITASELMVYLVPHAPRWNPVLDALRHLT